MSRVILQREAQSKNWLKTNQVIDANFCRLLIQAAQRWCDQPISDLEVGKALRGEIYETNGENYCADDLLVQLEIWFKEGIPK